MARSKAVYILWSMGLLCVIFLWMVLPPVQAQLLSGVVTLGLFVSMVYIYRQTLSIESDNKQYLYYALFEQNNDAIFWVDFDGKIIRVNQQACELLGYEMEEFPTLTMRDIVVGSELTHAQQSLQKLIDGARIPLYERTMRRKDGEPRQVEINIQMVYDAHGKAVCIQSVMRDISERKHNERALSDSEKRLRTLVSALPDSTFIVDGQGYYHRVLKSVYDTNYPLASYDGAREGRYIHDFYPREHADKCLEKIRQALESNSSLLFEYPCPYRADPYRYETRIIPYADPLSEQHLVFWVTRDITDQVLGERNRLDLALEKEKLSVLQEFVNGIVHDLKTPLAVMSVSLDLLNRYDDITKRQEKMRVMLRQVDLVTQMLEDMLAIVHLDTIPQLNFEVLDLQTILQEIMDDLLFKAQEKNIRLQFHTIDDVVMVEGSRNQLRRALSNLVDNAIKYTLVDGRVDVRLYYDEDYLYLDIQDTGIGIDSDDLQHIFDRFVRADNARTIASGTGLGLAITRHIIDIHGGVVTVKSQVDHGSTFRVKLPKQTTLQPEQPLL